MIVNSTEVQNNFGKYLMLSADRDIIITRNGLPVAKLTAFKDEESPVGCSHSMVKEGAPVILSVKKPPTKSLSN